MRRLVRVLVGLALCVAVGWAAAGHPSQAAPAKCTAGKAARVANGVRTCIPASRLRQRVVPPSVLVATVRRTLSGWPVKPLLKTRKPARRPTAPAVVNAIVARVAAAETQSLASLRSALASKSMERVHEIFPTAPTVTLNPNGSSFTANAGFGGTTNGSKVSANLQMTGSTSGRLGTGLDATVTDPSGGTKSFGFEISSSKPASGQDCPDANAILDLSSDLEATVRKGETFGPKQISLGVVREAHRVKLRAAARVQFGADGKARPFAFTVNAYMAYKRNARALFLHSSSRFLGTGSISGTLNPATGAVTGGKVATNVQTSGFDGTQAAADADLRAVLEQVLNEEVGRLLKKVRDAEATCGRYDVNISLTTYLGTAASQSSGMVNVQGSANLDPLATGAARFTGMFPAVYENLVFTPLVPCVFLNPVSTTAPIEVVIEVTPAHDLKVDWHVVGGPLSATASIQCPMAPLVPGQPGPALINPAPVTFPLPLEGGTTVITGGLPGPGGGWVHAGTITITRRWR